MNKNILKLVSQTGLYVEGGKVYTNRNDYPITEYMDQFAKLIIEECQKASNKYISECGEVSYLPESVFKNHFGVE